MKHKLTREPIMNLDNKQHTLEDKKQKIIDKLQAGVELELKTIPPYLTTLFSMKEGTNSLARDYIRSVMMEEMLHMTLACNVLIAIGGSVKLGKKNTPTYPTRLEFNGECFHERRFNVDLKRFNKENIQTFRRIELPEGYPRLDHLSSEKKSKEKGFEVGANTIGEFYQMIIDDLKELDEEYKKAYGDSEDPKKMMFNPESESNQISPEYYWSAGGKPVVVKDINTAEESIKLIIELGEVVGMEVCEKCITGDSRDDNLPVDLPHYFKFTEIYFSRHYKKGKPVNKLEPNGKNFKIDYSEDAVYPIKTNCKSEDFKNNKVLFELNRRFNKVYSLMLRELELGFNGQPIIFYNATLNAMHELLPIARNMAKIRINDDTYETGAPSFEWMDPYENIEEKNNGI